MKKANTEETDTREVRTDFNPHKDLREFI